MQLKKNPNIDAKRNSLLYFQIGLAAITALTYLGMELKTPDPIVIVEKKEIVETIVEEEIIPMTIQVQKAPPPPPPAPEVIQIVDDKVILEEKPIETTETNEKQEVTAPVNTGNIDEGGQGDIGDVDVEVPFAVLEDIPLFPGCEKVKGVEKQKECFNTEMNKHIKRVFRYPEKAREDGITGRATVMFVIDKTGAITNLRVKGPKNGQLLEAEAERIIRSLPKFSPGKQRGKAVSVSYSQPIMFTIQD